MQTILKIYIFDIHIFRYICIWTKKRGTNCGTFNSKAQINGSNRNQPPSLTDPPTHHIHIYTHTHTRTYISFGIKMYFIVGQETVLRQAEMLPLPLYCGSFLFLFCINLLSLSFSLFLSIHDTPLLSLSLSLG